MPVGKLDGVAILLAQADSFTAAYLRIALERAGAVVIDSAEAYQLEREGAPAPTIACFGLGFGDIWYPNLAADMARRGIPCLYLGTALANEMLNDWSWLPRPFAGHQVVDAVLEVLAQVPASAEPLSGKRAAAGDQQGR